MVGNLDGEIRRLSPDIGRITPGPQAVRVEQQTQRCGEDEKVMGGARLFKYWILPSPEPKLAPPAAAATMK